MTLRDLFEDLHNWARWRWAGLPNLQIPEPPAFELYDSGDYEKAAVTEGHDKDNRYDNAPDYDEPIDEPAAEATHSLILELEQRFQDYICDHWYLRKRVPHAKLQAAHDAILDIVNRWEGEFMERVA